MFDDVVLLDDRLVAEGKSAGREDGKARGFKEGEGMGKSTGFRMAAEMGFCRGCCLAWLALNERDPGNAKGGGFFGTSGKLFLNWSHTVFCGRSCNDASLQQCARCFYG